MKYITRKEIGLRINVIADAVRKLELRGKMPVESIKVKGVSVYPHTPELEAWMASNPVTKKDCRRDARVGIFPPESEDVRMLREFIKPALRNRRTHFEDMRA